MSSATMPLRAGQRAAEPFCRSPVGPGLFFSAVPCASPQLSGHTGGCVHHIADCGGNSRMGPVVGTFGKVAYTEHDR